MIPARFPGRLYHHVDALDCCKPSLYVKLTAKQMPFELISLTFPLAGQADQVM